MRLTDFTITPLSLNSRSQIVSSDTCWTAAVEEGGAAVDGSADEPSDPPVPQLATATPITARPSQMPVLIMVVFGASGICPPARRPFQHASEKKSAPNRVSRGFFRSPAIRRGVIYA